MAITNALVLEEERDVDVIEFALDSDAVCLEAGRHPNGRMLCFVASSFKAVVKSLMNVPPIP